MEWRLLFAREFGDDLSDDTGLKCVPCDSQRDIQCCSCQVAMLSLPHHVCVCVQIGDALSDAPAEGMEFAMRQESEQIVRAGQRIAQCMSK